MKETSQAKVLELKNIAKMLATHRDEATEKRFIDLLLTISTNTMMMASIQTDIDCLLDITELLCNVCSQFKLLGQLLTAWLKFLKHISSDTKYTIFLVIDIDIFRQCAKLFFTVRSNPKQMQIVKILSSYMEGNKHKTTDWLKQLFHCVVPADFMGKMTFYLGDEIGTSDYNRWMIYLINKYSTFDEQDSPNGIVNSTFYGDATNAALQSLDRSKDAINSVDEWALIHSSDDDDDTDQNDNGAAVNHETFSDETTNRSGEKPNPKQKSSEIRIKRAKNRLLAETIDVDEIEKDVYDFDEDDDGEPVLKKKRRVTQTKKKKNKSVAWPRVKVEPMAEKKRSKVYTIRVKKPVGAQVKALTAKAKYHCKPVEIDLLSNVETHDVETELQQSLVELSIHPPESVMAEADWAMGELDTPVIEPKKETKAKKEASKSPETSPLNLIPLEIIANIEKINDVVKIDSNNNTGDAKPQLKSQSKNTITVDSSNKPQTKKKPQPHKLYTEPEPEFDGIDMDQATVTKTEVTKKKQPTEQNG